MKPAATMNPTNVPHVLQHYFPSGYPVTVLNITESQSSPEDIAICRRLCAAYVRSCSDDSRLRHLSGGLWDDVQTRHHRSLIALLKSGDAEGLAKLMQNGLRSEAAFGLGSGPGWFKLAADPTTDGRVPAIIIDRLLSLAEAVGAISVENPETEDWGKLPYADLSKICSTIEGIVGVPIGTPEVFGLFGVEVSGSLVGVRTPDQVYTAWRLSNLCRISDGNSIVEIGGGYGGCAYYSALLGAQHTILDLPTTAALQGFFLCKSLGAERVRLFGEAFNSQSVYVLPYWCVHTLEPDAGTVGFCQDVLPELPDDLILQYIKAIPSIAKNYFYTINHESSLIIDGYQGNGHDVPPSVSQRLRNERSLELLNRSPYWIRRGYVEEIYRVI